GGWVGGRGAGGGAERRAPPGAAGLGPPQGFSPPPFDPTVAAELRKLLVGAPQMVAISVLDASGHVVQDSRTAQEVASTPLSPADLELLRAGDGNTLQISGPVKIETEPRDVFAVSRPLMTIDGNAAGLLVAYVDPAYFAALYRQVGVGADGTIMLLRNDGTVLVRQPAGAAGSTADTPALGQLIATSRDRPTMSALPPDGILRIVSAHSVANFPLTVAVG